MLLLPQSLVLSPLGSGISHVWLLQRFFLENNACSLKKFPRRFVSDTTTADVRMLTHAIDCAALMNPINKRKFVAI